MKVYETIISILDEKGPLSIPLICKEVNKQLVTDREKPLLPSQIKSIVSRKKDLFQIKEGNISIQPDKYPYLLNAFIDRDNGISYQVKIDFLKKRFTFFEWRSAGNKNTDPCYRPRKLGSLDVFKQEIFTMKIWEWKPYYQKAEGIILGKTNWKVKLETKGKSYISEGTDCYPEHWNHFCKSMERLIGVSLNPNCK